MAADAIEPGLDIETALTRFGRHHHDLMPELFELALEVLDVLRHAAGVRHVVWGDLRDLHERAAPERGVLLEIEPFSHAGSLPVPDDTRGGEVGVSACPGSGDGVKCAVVDLLDS